MKVGDKFPVTIAGQAVTEAVVKELADGTVTLEFTGQRVVMATRTELSTPPVNVDGTGTQTIIEGAERLSEGPVADETPSATVGENNNNDNQTQQQVSQTEAQPAPVQVPPPAEVGEVVVEGTQPGNDSTARAGASTEAANPPVTE